MHVLYVCMHVCLYACMFVCMYVCMHVSCMYKIVYYIMFTLELSHGHGIIKNDKRKYEMKIRNENSK